MDGGWSNWTPYGTCSVTCGSGTQTRDRKCDNPTPSGGGLLCTKSDGTRASTESDSHVCTLSACYGKIKP